MSNKLPKWANWIARDKSGALWIYKNQPIKTFVSWESVDGDQNDEIHDPKDVYSFVKWEDEEPWSLVDFGFHIATKGAAKDMADFGKIAITAKDNVNKPNHYIGIHGLEVEEVLQNFIPRYENSYAGHRVASAIEYLLRAPLKNKLEDIEKAKQNLEQILNYEKEQPHE